MNVFPTQHGSVRVDDWGYRLQGRDGTPLKASSLFGEPHDLIVMDFSRNGLNSGAFSKAQVARIEDGPGGPAVSSAYLSIGEASGFRSYWDDDWTNLPPGWSDGNKPKASYALTSDAPDWLGPINPEWPESRKVRYWDTDWQDLIFNDQKTGWLDRIVKQGFDSAYLDIVDAYYYWGAEMAKSAKETGDPANIKQAALRMVQFIVALTEHARETNPKFFVVQQNAEFLINDLGPGYNTLKKKYYKAVEAIAVEDTYFRGGKDENNVFKPDNDKIGVLKSDYLRKGVPVFSVDYLNQKTKIEKFFDEAIDDGFIPYAAGSRDLDTMAAPFGSKTKATTGSDKLKGTSSANAINGLAGDDTISGEGGEDKLRGAVGDDLLRGGDGDDQLFGGPGSDTLFGHAGADTLRGGGHADRLEGGAGIDLVDGGRGPDTIKGGSGPDVMLGGQGKDRVFGGNGDDTVKGGLAADVLVGGRGSDTLQGGTGADTLIGSGGNDTLFGEDGADVFKVGPRRGHDTIADFEDGVDQIDLTAFTFSSLVRAMMFFQSVDDQAVFSHRGMMLTLTGISDDQIGPTDLLI